jgi:LPS O-antigen subunit length determinant protein (WzzB/FepE family)
MPSGLEKKFESRVFGRSSPEVRMKKIRWNVSVSAETDLAVRQYLAGQPGQLSQFVEQAVITQLQVLALRRQESEKALDELVSLSQELKLY